MAIGTRVKTFLLGVVSALLLAGAPAFAVQVTLSNGVTYEITISGQSSFDTLNVGGFMEAQPWWGANATTNGFASADAAANEFRDEWLATSPTLQASSRYFFAFSFLNATNLNAAQARTDGTGTVVNTTNTTPNRTLDAGGSGSPEPFFYATATAVPEIDGPVLAQLGLVLGAGYLGLRARRRRHSAA